MSAGRKVLKKKPSAAGDAPAPAKGFAMAAFGQPNPADNGKKIDPSSLFGEVKAAPVDPEVVKAMRGKRNRGKEEDQEDVAPGNRKTRTTHNNAEIKGFRDQNKEQAKARKKHLSHLHDPVNEEESKRTVFVSNLPNTCTTKDLKRIFNECGEVENARVRCQKLDESEKKGKEVGRGVRILRGDVAKSDRLSATGYVIFKHSSAIDDALRMCGQVHLERHLTVSKEDSQSKAFDPQNSIYLGNLPYDVADEDIWTMFLEHGFSDINKVRVIRSRDTGKSIGVGYVSFRNPSTTNKAIGSCRQAMIHGREVRICHVQRPKDPKYKTLSRREVRREAERTAPKSGPVGSSPIGGKGPVRSTNKTSIRRLAAESALQGAGTDDGARNPSWMGTVTNPRKKMPRDLRSLIPMSLNERKQLRKNGGGGRGGGAPGAPSGGRGGGAPAGGGPKKSFGGRGGAGGRGGGGGGRGGRK